MTCIEKLRELHPDWDDEKVRYHVEHCCVEGSASGYIMPRPLYCGAHGWEDSDDIDCEKCWNREVDEKHNRHATTLLLTGEDRRRMDRLKIRIGKTREEVVAAALKLYEDALDAVEKSQDRWSSVSLEKEEMVIFDEQE